jgi:hypothetical protein
VCVNCDPSEDSCQWSVRTVLPFSVDAVFMSEESSSLQEIVRPGEVVYSFPSQPNAWVKVPFFMQYSPFGVSASVKLAPGILLFDTFSFQVPLGLIFR